MRETKTNKRAVSLYLPTSLMEQFLLLHERTRVPKSVLMTEGLELLLAQYAHVLEAPSHEEGRAAYSQSLSEQEETR